MTWLKYDVRKLNPNKKERGIYIFAHFDEDKVPTVFNPLDDNIIYIGETKKPKQTLMIRTGAFLSSIRFRYNKDNGWKQTGSPTHSWWSSYYEKYKEESLKQMEKLYVYMIPYKSTTEDEINHIKKEEERMISDYEKNKPGYLLNRKKINQ